MKVEIWADITCPFCGITHFRLREVVRRLREDMAVTLRHRSAPAGSGLPTEGIPQAELARRAGMSAQLLDATLVPLEHAAEAEGFGRYRARDRQVGPTALTHEFLAFATDAGAHDHAWDAAFRAHFAEGQQLWSVDQLAAFAEEIGLDPAAARDALNARRFRRSVGEDHQRGMRFGLRSIPFIVIDERYALSGAQDPHMLRAALQQAWSDHDPGTNRPTPAV